MTFTRELVAELAPITDRVHRGHCWIKTADGPRRIDEPLDDFKIAQHVERRQVFGACPIAPGESTTRLAVLDFDSHKGETPWEEMLHTSEFVAFTLEQDGYKPVLYRSSGGHGVHLFLLWEGPQDAYSVREMLKHVLAVCSLKPGTGGVASGEVEVFPKQDAVPADGYGSMFILPGAGHSEHLGNYIGWPISPPVPVVEKPAEPARSLGTISTDVQRLASALDAIPNNNNEELNYEDWRNVIFAIHHATDGSGEGLELAHRFSQKSTKYDPDFLDNRVWPYIRSDRDGSTITERTLYRLAETKGWQDPEVADDFDIIEGEVPREANPRFTPIPAVQFAKGRPLAWIVKDVLPQAELAVVFGASGSGKTFLTLDLVAAIARGVEWRGKRTKKGRVVYIAAEGAHGFRNRLNAYAHQYLDDRLEDLDVAVIPDSPNFMEKTDILDLGHALLAHGQVDVVVVDTFARVSVGADENSGEDVGRVIEHCRTLHKVTGAMIIVIHHSGKTEGRGARGWSGLRAAVDAEIEIMRADDDRVATVTKLKDHEDGAEFAFKLLQVPVGEDEDGEVITSCVVEHTSTPPRHERKVMPKGTRERLVLKLATDMIDLAGGGPKVNELITEVVNQTPFDDAEGKRDRRREVALRALENLVAGNLLRVDGGEVVVL